MFDRDTGQKPLSDNQEEPEALDLSQATPEQLRAFEQRKIEERIAKKRNSPHAAILAHCHQCLGYYHDGREDCKNVKCPLYTWMPFRELEPEYDWCNYNAKRIGKQRETYSAEAALRAKDSFSNVSRD